MEYYDFSHKNQVRKLCGQKYYFHFFCRLTIIYLYTLLKQCYKEKPKKRDHFISYFIS